MKPRFNSLLSMLRAPSVWVLLFGSLLSVWLAWHQWQEIEARSQQRFNREVASLIHSIDARFRELSTLLLASKSLFAGSQQVTPLEFTAFAQQFDLPHLQPAIQGLGYAQWLPQAQRDSLIQTMRADGQQPDFHVWPVCAGAYFSSIVSIVSIVPLDQRNRRAIGYDMYCEPTRRAAMDAAAVSQQTVLSAVVQLVQDPGAPQPGMLLYLSVFDTPAPLPGRRNDAALRGWVYIPINAGNLMQVLLASTPNRLDFTVAITDVTVQDSPMPLYTSAGLYSQAHFSQRVRLALYGRSWEVNALSSAEFERNVSYSAALYALAAGLGLTLLVAVVMEWLRRGRRAAEKLAEAMTHDLRERNTVFETLFQSTPDATLIVDAMGRIVRHNRQASSLFGYADVALDQLTVEDLIPAMHRDAHREHRKQYAAQPQVREMGSSRDLTALRVDGSVFQVEVRLAPLSLQGQPHVLAVVRDISDRRRMETSQARMLKDKETLLQEVHHRVKNNLQVIHSLFELQVDSISDPTARACLADAQARVRAMALIHQVLYQSHDFAEVNFSDYLALLLRDLGATLGRPEIVVRCDTQAVRMNLQRAIPSGLLMSEAVSNAYKHAFPGQRSGVISLSLRQVADGVEMTVADNGVGLPPDWRERDTLGMRLITLLAEQCGARLSIQTGMGTRIALYWKVESEKAERNA